MYPEAAYSSLHGAQSLLIAIFLRAKSHFMKHIFVYLKHFSDFFPYKSVTGPLRKRNMGEDCDCTDKLS